MPHGGNRDRGNESWCAAAIGEGDGGRRDGPSGRPWHRRRRAQRLRLGHRDIRHRRRRVPRRHRRDRGAITEAVRGVRHRREPHDRSRRAGLIMDVGVVVVGAGPAGLAMSAQLDAAGVEHVVLERGEVANSWRTERWDSLRLLTPNWMTRLPGTEYRGDDPDGFMTASETVAFLDDYRRQLAAPVRTHVTVERVTHTDAGFEVVTDDGRWTCDAVVAASGASSEPRIPSFATTL